MYISERNNSPHLNRFFSCIFRLTRGVVSKAITCRREKGLDRRHRRGPKSILFAKVGSGEDGGEHGQYGNSNSREDAYHAEEKKEMRGEDTLWTSSMPVVYENAKEDLATDVGHFYPKPIYLAIYLRPLLQTSIPSQLSLSSNRRSRTSIRTFTNMHALWVFHAHLENFRNKCSCGDESWWRMQWINRHESRKEQEQVQVQE
ncbi:hypothetical protein AOL_s00054g958 [Orbilia oligospora ATCC 24927]|uniref:Uncharacterized protein n=1 Tax=Arthrobotrys oligospora (strain ATCC 24927 / CBS 115.81 / DSM 1491) TaxID=756982 RepID=G1X7P1_ARTOA|nr:hypothetical protein AOL_s00054g958 [Orbilia oligospora ATCC 24927]EGX50872.1 hypothetical protein AOL_s00054g958 [Orbilia oligospora ATCC 24927]